MSCLGTVYVGRTPALERPPAGSRAPVVHGRCDTMTPIGGRKVACEPLPVRREGVLLTSSLRSGSPSGFPRRPHSAGGVAQPCRLPALPMHPRPRARSRMLPTIQAYGAPVPYAYGRKAKLSSLETRRPVRKAFHAQRHRPVEEDGLPG